MQEKFAKWLHFWPNYHFDYIFEGVNIFYYLLYKPEFSTFPPPHHHTTSRKRGVGNKNSPIHTDQPQTKSFRGTLKIHLLSSVPPSNTQHQIQHICKADTEECINIRTGGKIKSSFLFKKNHRKEFSINSEIVSHIRIHTLVFICMLKLCINTGWGFLCGW